MFHSCFSSLISNLHISWNTWNLRVAGMYTNLDKNTYRLIGSCHPDKTAAMRTTHTQSGAFKPYESGSKNMIIIQSYARKFRLAHESVAFLLEIRISKTIAWMHLCMIVSMNGLAYQKIPKHKSHTSIPTPKITVCFSHKRTLYCWNVCCLLLWLASSYTLFLLGRTWNLHLRLPSRRFRGRWCWWCFLRRIRRLFLRRACYCLRLRRHCLYVKQARALLRGHAFKAHRKFTILETHLLSPFWFDSAVVGHFLVNGGILTMSVWRGPGCPSSRPAWHGKLLPRPLIYLMAMVD